MNIPAHWDLVRTFLVLSEHLHYRKAAEELGVSAQALSKRIARLEAQLDVPLLIRSTRRVELTPAGRTLRDLATPAAASMDRALELTRRERADRRLSVAVSTDLTAPWTTQVEAWVNTRGAPALLERRACDDALRLVRAGDMDLALIAGDLHDDPSSTIVGHEPALVLFPDDHPAARQTAIRRGDLRDLPVAVSDAGMVEHHRATVEQLHGDPDLPHLLSPRVGTITQGLIHTARTRRAAALVLQRAAARADTSTLAARPMDPPSLFAVTLIARADLPPEPSRSLTDHLLSLALLTDE